MVTTYTADGVNYKREYISSLSGNVIMVHLTASRKGMITCNANMTSPQQDVTIKSEGKEIVLSGISGWHEGLKGKVQFTGRATARTEGGTVTSSDGVPQIKNADEATIYLTIATNFKSYNDISGNDTVISEKTLDEALKNSFAQIKQKHYDIYSKQYGRVNLNLGGKRLRQPPHGLARGAFQGAQRRAPRGDLLPIRTLPSHLHVAAGHTAAYTAGTVERQDAAVVGQQVHLQHKP